MMKFNEMIKALLYQFFFEITVKESDDFFLYRK
ncbi:MAG: hypothetical protein ACJA1B_000368 [Polaribacter sp.]|jgi:hypothetical protein